MNVFKRFVRWLSYRRMSPAQRLEEEAWKNGHCYTSWNRKQVETLAGFLATHRYGEKVFARFDTQRKCAVLSTKYQILARLTLCKLSDIPGWWLNVETDLVPKDYGLWFTLAFMRGSGVNITYEPLETPLLLTYKRSKT